MERASSPAAPEQNHATGPPTPSPSSRALSSIDSAFPSIRALLPTTPCPPARQQILLSQAYATQNSHPWAPFRRPRSSIHPLAALCLPPRLPCLL
ncbi:hypothetical protein FALBO_16647, partial [Fusarium albosuccineum]